MIIASSFMRFSPGFTSKLVSKISPLMSNVFSPLQSVSCVAFLSMGFLQVRQTKSEAEKNKTR